MSEQQKVQYKQLAAKIKANPNSPKVKMWKEEIAKLRPKIQQNTGSAGHVQQLPAAEYRTEERVNNVYSPERNISNTVSCSTNPDENQYSLCDAVTQPVNLLKSISEQVVTVNFDGSNRSGFFSFATQPTLGSLTEASKQAIGIVDTSNGWPADFTSPSSYVSSTSGSNPKIDSQLLTLINPTPKAWSISRTFTAYTTQIGNDGFLYRKSAGSLDPGASQLNSLQITQKDMPSTTFTGLVNVTVSNPCVYTVPSGVYVVNSTIYMEPSVLSTERFTLVAIDYKDSVLGTVSWGNNSTIPSAVTGYFIGNVKPLYAHNGIAAFGVPDYVPYAVNFVLRISGDVRIMPILVSQTSGNYSVLDAYLGFTTTIDADLPTVNDNGNVVTLRPIAHSALLTCLLPDILAGGNLVAYSAPSGDIRNMYYSNSSLIRPQEWYQLGTLNKGNMMYDSKVKDGTYVWTQPWSENDILLRTPSEMVQYSYPGIMVSGVVIPPNGYSGIVSAFRLKVITIWEFVTDSTIFTPVSLLGDPSQMGKAMSILAELQHALPNSKHKQYVKKLKSILHSNSNKKNNSNFMSDVLGMANSMLGPLLSIL